MRNMREADRDRELRQTEVGRKLRKAEKQRQRRGRQELAATMKAEDKLKASWYRENRLAGARAS